MQTFLPYSSFIKTFKCLDYRRLGKQRVEAYQILNILLEGTDRKGWRNHPAVKMWKGYENALKQYHNECIKEWIHRGYNNNMKYELILGNTVMPPWVGKKTFHQSHQSNLIRKFPEHYSAYWPKVPDNLPYVWPI